MCSRSYKESVAIRTRTQVARALKIKTKTKTFIKGEVTVIFEKRKI